MSMPPGSTEGAARAEQADRVEEIEIESVPPKAGRQPNGPGPTITLEATAPLRRPTPWLIVIALIAGGLCAAAAGWLVRRMEIADHETAAASAQSGFRASTKRLASSGEELAQEPLRRQELERQLAARQGEHDTPAQERARLEQQLAPPQNDQRLQAMAQKRDQAIEQQQTGRRDQEALVWERARSKELEQQLALRYVEKEALAKERARSKILEQELEQQLAARQGDQAALAQERARGLALERELVELRYTVPTQLPAFELFPTWPALALNSVDPAPPPPAAREAMPAAPTDKPAVE
jgi:hypothetical protein